MKATQRMSAILFSGFAAASALGAGVMATGGLVTNYVEDGVGYQAHLFKDVGSCSFTVTSGGSVEVLVVAGGGGGGRFAGGGAAGGLIYTNAFAVSAGNYTVTVGNGGAGASANYTLGASGENSVFGSLTAYGGGGGGSRRQGQPYDGQSGGGGGSGGGGSPADAAPQGMGGAATNGQGCAGGNGGGYGWGGGGGGGAGNVGSNATGNNGGNGGDGLAFSISGSSTYYAGGGGGGTYVNGQGTAGAGGQGGGAAGSRSTVGSPGAANTGGGGGAHDTTGPVNGGSGGSGIVIVRYLPDVEVASVVTGSATNITTSSAWLCGNLTSTGASATAAIAYWGATDGGTNAANWTSSGTLAAPQSEGEFSIQATGLSADSTYYYRVAASNDVGVAWAPACAFFITGELTITKTSDAQEATLVPGVFTVERPATTTNEALVATYMQTGGSATGGVDFVALSGTLTIPAGAASATIAVTPLKNWVRQENSKVELTLQPGGYAIGTGGTVELTIVNEGLPLDKNVWVATATGNASVAANWSQNRAPEAGDAILLGGYSTANLNWDAAATNVVASWTQTVDYTGTVTFQTVYGASGFTNMTIAGDALLAGGTWTHGDNSTAEIKRLCVSVGGNLTVASNAVITADFLGYDGWQGTGVGTAQRAGAGYGGSGGGVGGGACYGSVYAPTNLGSGGAGPLPGGGAIVIRAGGTVTADGLITANGQGGTDETGCGSGGTIFITAGGLGGTGALTAHGGSMAARYGAGGGGGRIAVVLTGPGGNGLASIQASGGYGPRGTGGAGTFYYQAPGDEPGRGTVTVRDLYATTIPGTLPAMVNPVDNLRGSMWVLAENGYLKMATNAQIRKMDIAKTTAKLDLAGKTLTTINLTITNQVIRSGVYTAASLGSGLVTDSVGAGQLVVVGLPQTLISVR